MTRVLALDLSLTSTGYATPDGHPGTLPTSRRGAARLSRIRDRVLELHHDTSADLVALEGYAYGKANQAHQVGELGGVIRCSLHDAGLPFIVVPPSTIKKYATGKGVADKTAMIVAARERLGYVGMQSDEADALWIRAVVLEAVGEPAVTLPKAHVDAVTSSSGKGRRVSLVDQAAAALGGEPDAA